MILIIPVNRIDVYNDVDGQHPISIRVLYNLNQLSFCSENDRDSLKKH